MTNDGFMIRGLMLDPARLQERMEIYRDLIKLTSEFGYNTIFWHFTDDSNHAGQGCAIRFRSHPEMASLNAFSIDETKNLISFCRSLGMELIPELECFGHTGYIRKKFDYLIDRKEGKLFASIAPFHPDSRKILKELLTEVAEIFPSPYIHVGMDEASYGSHPHTKELLKTKKKYEIFAEHICWLYSIVKDLGKEMMMWGDHLLPVPQDHTTDYLDHEALSSKIADMIPKDIIICDWHYDPAKDFPSLDFFLEKGFRVIACPSTSAWGTLVLPRKWNLDNIHDFCASAWKRKNNKNLLGIMNTVWCGQRSLPGAFVPGIAYCAQCISKQENSELDPAWVNNCFAFPENLSKTFNNLLWDLMQICPNHDLWLKLLPTGNKDLANVSEQDLNKIEEMRINGEKLYKFCCAHEKEAKKNKVFFDDLKFISKIIYRTTRRFTDIHNLIKEKRALPQDLLSEAEEFYLEGEERWDLVRFPDDPQKKLNDAYAFQSRLYHSYLFLKNFTK